MAAGDTRDRLIQSAIVLLPGRSYAEVGVDELCRHAGVRKGSFYYFFPTKRDLALAALDRQWDELRRSLLEPAFAPDTPPLERIRRFFFRAGRYHRQLWATNGRLPGCPFGNLAAEVSTQDEVLRKKLSGIFKAMTGYFKRALDDAVDEETLAPCNTGRVARTLVAYLEGVLLLAKTDNNPRLLQSLGSAALHLVGDAPE